MAKMFYSIEEAAQRLGKSVDDVQRMASSGQLQEFKDREKLMFKREQVDLLAGDAGEVSLSDAGKSGIGLGGSSLTLALEDDPGGSAAGGKGGGAKQASGSGLGIETDEPGQRSGVSIFDTEATDTTDPLAATAITPTARRGSPSGGEAELTAMDAGGSGSGLLDLTREADDTSLGADLLEDVYKGDEEGGPGGSRAGINETQGASGLFETTSAPSDMSAAAVPAMVMMTAEPYDGVWSGIAGGLAVGLIVACVATLFVLLSGMLGAADTSAVSLLTNNLWAVVGAFAGVMVVGAVVGFVLGRKT